MLTHYESYDTDAMVTFATNWTRHAPSVTNNFYIVGLQGGVNLAFKTTVALSANGYYEVGTQTSTFRQRFNDTQNLVCHQGVFLIGDGKFFFIPFANTPADTFFWIRGAILRKL